MKLIIEIPDEALRHAVQSQVGKALSEMTSEEIKKQAQEILQKAFSRIDPFQIAREEASRMLVDHVDGALSDVVGRKGWQRQDYITKLITAAAKNLLRDTK